jgi:hypothetical protein
MTSMGCRTRQEACSRRSRVHDQTSADSHHRRILLTAGSWDVRGIAPSSRIGSSRKLLRLNKLQDSALRPSRRFARSAQKALTGS